MHRQSKISVGSRDLVWILVTSCMWKPTIPYEKLANIETPCRRWTKYRYRIYDRWRSLNVVSISHVVFFFLSQACIHQKSTSAFPRKREKISNWSVQRSKSQVIGCPTTSQSSCQKLCIHLPLSLKSSIYWPTLDRRGQMNGPQYRQGSSFTEYR